jgi:uncharacterized protein (DUF1330 family)
MSRASVTIAQATTFYRNIDEAFMAFEMLVGLQVRDADLYRNYREAMDPILQKYGGRFGYDFWISETLKSETPEPLNRVFTITFPTKDMMDNFFSDPDYLQVKNQFFKASVQATTIISQYER